MDLLRIIAGALVIAAGVAGLIIAAAWLMNRKL